MYKSVILVFLLISVLFTELQASSVYYLTERVTMFNRDNITINNRQYQVSKHCSYKKHQKKNDAYFVEDGSQRDVSEGDSVVVRVNGTVVDEISVEEWKK